MTAELKNNAQSDCKTESKNAAAEPSVPSSAVPWDRSLLQGRDCQHCACYFEAVNPIDPKQFQGFCRLKPADIAQVAALEPRLDARQQLVMREGQPVMNRVQRVGFMYRATQREGTCFDGYRPIGTLPGEGRNDKLLKQLLPIVAEMASGNSKAVERLGRALLDNLDNLLDSNPPSATQ